MAVVISLLRAVNVGGHNKLPMDALRKLYDELGLRDVRTYIQSGNVVFRTAERDLVRLRKRIEDGIEKRFGFRSDVILRTTRELSAVVGNNPFARRGGLDPRRLLVTFLAGDPDGAAKERALKLKSGADELRIAGSEVYMYFSDGVGRATLSPALVEKTLRISGTGRNWNTVNKLLEIALELDGRPEAGRRR